jgi:hypothetical protein
VNNAAVPGDLFFLTYARHSIYLWIIDCITNSRFWLLLLITGINILWGFCLVGLVSLEPAQRNIRKKIFLALIVSLVTPIFFIQTLNFLQIHISKYLIFLTVLAPIVIYLIKLICTQRTTGQKINLLQNYSQKDLFLAKFWPDILLIILFFLAAISRAAQVNNILVPNWVDGQVHQQIFNRILASEISVGNTYHTGFHAFAAYLYLLFGLSPQESIIVVGQWLSLISGLTLYPLIRRYPASPQYALFGAAIFWFMLPFPSYLVSWARYPLLLGMVIIPAAILLNVDWLQAKTKSAALPIVTAIALLFSHYGTFLAFIMIILSYLLWDGFSLLQKKTRRLDPLRVKKFIIITAFPIIFLVGIKIVELVKDNSIQKLIAQNGMAIASSDLGYLFTITLKNGGEFGWGLGALGLLYAIFRKRELLLPSLIWTILQIGLYLIQVAVIGAAASSITNIIVVFSIPTSILAANAAEAIIEFTDFTESSLFGKGTHGKWIISICTSFLILMGSYNISGVINPVTVMFNQNDLSAIEWINQNTDLNAKFLIDAFQWNGNYVPSDGGGWIYYLSSRQTIFPTSPSDLSDSERLIIRESINYVFIGQGYGELNPIQFQNSSTNLVYTNNGVKIYEILSPRLVQK